MRNLIVCCDGTWSTPDHKDGGLPAPTNVVKLYNLCVEGSNQLRYYHPGVGTEGSALHRAMGGGIGAGLDRNIQSAYQWLCRNYRRDDRACLFGFSRGAYTARSLGGFILHCGLLDLAGLSPAEGWSRVETAYREGYRARRPRSVWGPNWSRHTDSEGSDPDIHFIGVWDTVGARGIPDDLVWLDLLLDDPSHYSFHDTRLSPRVHHAYHAVALDEPRASFAPTLWTLEAERPADTSFAQLWFPGCHSDVGGGYAECGLSDAPLRWIAEQAEAHGIGIDRTLLAQLCPNPRAPMHDPVEGIWKLLRTLPRAVPPMAEHQVGKTLHPSAWERHRVPPIAQAPYRRTRTLAAGETWAGSIYAREHWNDTGVWLEAGVRYRLEAGGEWVDLYNKSGPEGMPGNSFELGDLAYRLGDLLGLGEGVYQRITGKTGADWWATKRLEEAPWFALVGMVSNQPDVDGGGTPPLGQTLAIGRGCEFAPDGSGYLYCFANDAWRFYGNNRGSVELKIARA
jgi:hypothetical protein